jgi:hypothetical protein
MAAPRGNKYALANKGGRFPMYKTPEEMQVKIDAYFNRIKRIKEPATITGLHLALDLFDRNTLYDYEQKEDFARVIKQAMKRVEHAYEKKLQSQYVAGAIFALKNMGWKDKNETDLNLNLPVSGLFIFNLIMMFCS